MKQKLRSSSDPNAGPSDMPVDKHLTSQNFGKMCEVIQKDMGISLFPGTVNLGHIEFYSYDREKVFTTIYNCAAKAGISGDDHASMIKFWSGYF